ncbi:MAG: rhomboid family intramembrane serine protease [Gemmatimonadaceae bacterium]
MTPWVSRLIATNVAVFFLCQVQKGLEQHLALFPAFVGSEPWTPLTYMFVHASITHIFFNMLMLYFVGPRLEQRIGGANFIALYLVSGLAGAALSFFTPTTFIVGASGAVNGVVLAYALIWPRDRIYIWGILPVEIRVLVLLSAAYAIFGGLGGARDGTAHFAHLGGYMGGFLYLKWAERNSASRQYRKRLDSALYGDGGARAAEPEWDAIRRDGLHPLNLEELDRIREKTRTHGPGSLTADERAFLHRMSTR